MRIVPVVALSLLVCLPAATARSGDVALSIRPSGAVLVPVEIDGRGPFTFLLDTGSSHTVLAGELAGRLTLPVVAKARVLSAAGAEMGLVVSVRRMDVGTAGVEGLLPSVVSLARLRDREPGIEGVLGQDFLAQFDYTLDYRRKRLLWRADPADTPLRLPLVRVAERQLVQLPGDRRHAPARLVPDSGSDGFVIYERDGRTAVDVAAGDQLVAVSGLASWRAGRAAALAELRLGAVTLRGEPAVVIQRDGPSAGEGDGLLPLHLFSSVSFRNSEGYLVVRR